MKPKFAHDTVIVGANPSVKDTTTETHWEKAAKTKMGIYLTNVETDFVLNAINLAECSVVIDLGAEAGRFSIIVAKNNVDVIAIDVEVHGLKKLRLKNKLVNVILADARRIPLKENLLDAAFMIEVLDYIPELETVLMECHRILKCEGSLILSFGNKSSLKSKLRKSRKKSYMHSYHRVIQSLERVGFEIVSYRGFNWLPFNRTSENPSIPLLAIIEKALGLRKIPSFSPWVIIHATKLK